MTPGPLEPLAAPRTRSIAAPRKNLRTAETDDEHSSPRLPVFRSLPSANRATCLPARSETGRLPEARSRSRRDSARGSGSELGRRGYRCLLAGRAPQATFRSVFSNTGITIGFVFKSGLRSGRVERERVGAWSNPRLVLCSILQPQSMSRFVPRCRPGGLRYPGNTTISRTGVRNNLAKA